MAQSQTIQELVAALGNGDEPSATQRLLAAQAASLVAAADKIALRMCGGEGLTDEDTAAYAGLTTAASIILGALRPQR